MNLPDPEDYLVWRDGLIAKAFIAALRAYAEERRDLWMQLSWAGGEADEVKLHGLKGAASTAEFFADLTFAQLKDILDPQEETA